jgi:hypothetical protein
MENPEKPVWLHEPQTPLEEGEEDNPECFPIDICGCKSCDCDSKLL